MRIEKGCHTPDQGGWLMWGSPCWSDTVASGMWKSIYHLPSCQFFHSVSCIFSITFGKCFSKKKIAFGKWCPLFLKKKLVRHNFIYIGHDCLYVVAIYTCDQRLTYCLFHCRNIRLVPGRVPGNPLWIIWTYDQMFSFHFCKFLWPAIWNQS